LRSSRFISGTVIAIAADSWSFPNMRRPSVIAIVAFRSRVRRRHADAQGRPLGDQDGIRGTQSAGSDRAPKMNMIEMQKLRGHMPQMPQRP
jgi:hypothetical protein